MEKAYHKLIRDRIPEIIESTGKKCRTEIMGQEAYLAALDEKLNEELREYQESKSLEELADLLEVMQAVVKARGFSWEQLTSLQEKKRADRGGFDEKLLLLEVSD